MFKNIKGVIFDLDGTLVNSMWIWSRIDDEYLNMKGHSTPKDLNAEINHLSFTQTAQYFKDRFNISDSIEEILYTWNTMALNHYKNDVKLKCGVKEFLDKLKSHNISISLATSNSQELLHACLKSNGIYEYFDTITTTDEVSRGKNFPDVYLLSASKMGISPDNCAVFEDILPAIKGAKAANMKVFAVKDDACVNTKAQLIEYADMYIDSFTEILDLF
ncbi:MAG: HAD family phosphatase [Clostridium butyricum]|nr:HAD family phosphatase [Clostridium butyricum]